MSEPAGTPEPELPKGAVRVTIRRAPRYRAFVLLGAVLGLVAGAVASVVLGGGSGAFTPTTLTGYVGAIGLLVGGLVGAAVAVLVERPRSR
jgi:putative Ca2+/H+ antiporter (TMEM165/GDT1 family)